MAACSIQRHLKGHAVDVPGVTKQLQSNKTSTEMFNPYYTQQPFIRGLPVRLHIYPVLHVVL